MFDKKLEPTSGIKDYKSCIDFSVLAPVFGITDLQRAANIAYKNKYRSLCVLPFAVEEIKSYITEKFGDSLRLGCVVGFPLGASLLSTKIDEAKRALNAGADYIDCVINLANVKMGNFVAVKHEISRFVRAARRHEINVIIETSALSRDEIERVCKICAKCKVDNVMTSTGFGSGGASPEVVEVLKQTLNSRCGIKASGGVSSREDALNLLRAGATLIATSREV